MVFKRILKEKISGTLTVRNDQFHSHLYFEKGTLVYAQTNLLNFRLPELLLESGKIKPEQFSEIQELLKTEKKKIGNILVAQNVISHRDLYHALEYQLEAIAIHTFSVKKGEWDFAHNPPTAEQKSGIKLEMDRVVMKGMEKVESVNRFRKEYLRHAPVFRQVDRKALDAISEKEYHFIKGAKKLKTPSHKEIIKALKISEVFYWRTLFVLNVLNVVDLFKPKIVKRKIPLTKELSQIYDAIKKKSLSYYQVLGLKDFATKKEVAQAYYFMTDKFSAEKFGDQLDGECRKKLNLVMVVIKSAFSTLTNSEAKEAYDFHLLKPESGVDEEEKQGEGDTDPVDREYYKIAKAYYQQKKYEGAIPFIEEAIKYNQEQASYFMLLGMCQSQLPVHHEKAEKTLLKVADMERWNADPYFILGKMYQATGAEKKARKFFEKALDVNAQHTLAGKMIRELKGGGTTKINFLPGFLKKGVRPSKLK